MPFFGTPPKTDSDDDDLGETSGSGDSGEVYNPSTTIVSRLTSLSEMAPEVDQLEDDPEDFYLYVLAAVVAAVVFIFVVVILIVSIRRQAKNKKMTQRGDRANLLTVEIQTDAKDDTWEKHGQVNSTHRPARCPHTSLAKARGPTVTTPAQDGRHHP